MEKLRFRSFRFFFYFFVFTRFWRNRLLFNERCMNSSRKGWLFPVNSALFMDPQISLFSNFFIKNGSHGTIYTFKNYFATVFSVFSFSKISPIQTDPWAYLNNLKGGTKGIWLFFFLGQKDISMIQKEHDAVFTFKKKSYFWRILTLSS